MCFSAPASFASGIVLTAAGTFCIKETIKKDKKYLLFSLIPLFFGLQQLIEGFVWLNIYANNLPMIKTTSLAFLFFVFAFWPIYAPLAVYFTEREIKSSKRTILLVILALGIGSVFISFIPLFFGISTYSTTVVNHSIGYDTNFSQNAKDIYLLFYVLIVLVPFFITSNIRIRYFGLFLSASVILAQIYYRYAFTSVWCFFAALLSAYIVWVIKNESRELKVENRA